MVSVANNFPVASTTATLHPVRIPGSRPRITFGPAGDANNNSCRFLAKILIASASAASRNLTKSSVLIWRCILTRHVHSHTPASHLSAGRPRSSMPA